MTENIINYSNLISFNLMIGLDLFHSYKNCIYIVRIYRTKTNDEKELYFCQKLWFSNPFIFAT